MSSKLYASSHKKLGLCRNCPSPVAEGNKTYCEYHRNKNREYGRKKDRKADLKLKEECFKHYGQKCGCCGETTFEFLTIEHKNRGGNIHRKLLFKHNVGGAHIYRWLKKNNFPDEFSLLCMNCNWAKRYGSICPHELRRDRIVV